MALRLATSPGWMDAYELPSPPQFRVCHVCGRQYGTHSFEIHLKQCKELWKAREALKEKSERKPLPRDPPILALGTDLNEVNRLASEIYNTVSLSTCAHCGRSFLTEKLILHNTSCTADNPGKRITGRADLNTAEEAEERERERRLRPRWNPQTHRSNSSDLPQQPQNGKHQTPQKTNAQILTPRKGSGGAIKCPSDGSPNVQKNDADVKTVDSPGQLQGIDETKEESNIVKVYIPSLPLFLERAADELESVTESGDLAKEYSTTFDDCPTTSPRRTSHETESVTQDYLMYRSSDSILALPGRVEEMESTVASLRTTISTMQLQIDELVKRLNQEREEKKAEEFRRERKIIYTKVEEKKPASSNRAFKWLISSHH